jgi:hypothetical protein
MEGWIMHRLRQSASGLAVVALVCGMTLFGLLGTQAQTKAKAQSKAAAKSQAPAKKKARATPAKGTAESTTGSVAPTAPRRRDPFLTLVRSDASGSTVPQKLPPGKAGLMISTLRLDGVVRGPNGMLAVATNPQLRTYFLRQGDRLYDGRVEQITMEGVTFKEEGKDPFGKPIDRVVTKRIYPSAGEQ